MMRPSSRECEELFQETTKQEAADTHQMMQASSSSSSRQWSTSALRNPRIVRVSRTFGGKDRHSKVCTVRGLRDRRIRLSVPTAIQLYDLQDRLGLSQPSKVIDWLLDAAKHDVDKLPPLHFPPHHPFTNNHHPHHLVYGQYSALSGNLGSFDNWVDLGGGGGGGSSRTRRESLDLGGGGDGKGKWVVRSGEDDDVDREENRSDGHRGFGGFDHDLHLHVPSSNNSNKNYNTTTNTSITTAFLNNPTVASPYNNGNFGHLQQQWTTDHSGNNNNDGSSQLFLCPPPPAAAAMSSSTLFPTYPSFLGSASHHVDGGHLQLFSSSSNSNSSSASTQQMLPGNYNSSSFIRPFHQLMNANPGFRDFHRNKQHTNDSDS